MFPPSVGVLQLWQLGDKIHRDSLPLPFWNLWLLQETRRSLILHLDFSTSQTFADIRSYISFHVWPPIKYLQILIHLIGARVNRIPGFVSFIQNKLAQSPEQWDPNTSHKIV